MAESAKQQTIQDISRDVAEKRLRHRVAHVLCLAETAQAHEFIELGRVRGCVLFDPRRS